MARMKRHAAFYVLAGALALALAAAGYNAAKDEAVVHLRNVVSTDRGEAYFVILKKEAGSWNTKYRIRTWQQ